MSLPDPRKYPAENIRNPLINRALSVEQSSGEAHAASQLDELTRLFAAMLSNRENAALNAAFSQAPSAKTWHTLLEAMDAASSTTDSAIFTIPVIIVAGGDQESTLSTAIDPEHIQEILQQHSALSSSTKVTLHPALLSAETLAAISPADVFEWHQTSQAIPAFFQSVDTDAESITVKEESAWLRFIVGQISPRPTKLNLGKAAMPLSQALGNSLRQEQLSVLALPHSIHTGWFAGLEAGQRALLETRLQLLVSNAVRAIRSKKRTPVGTISTHQCGEIRITLSSLEDSERWNGFVWPIGIGDQIDDICHFVTALFQDCQISDIRVIDMIQPDIENDLPFFVTAHFPPRRPAS